MRTRIAFASSLLLLLGVGPAGAVTLTMVDAAALHASQDRSARGAVLRAVTSASVVSRRLPPLNQHVFNVPRVVPFRPLPCEPGETGCRVRGVYTGDVRAGGNGRFGRRDFEWDSDGEPQGAVPEPGAALLFGAGALLVGARLRAGRA